MDSEVCVSEPWNSSEITAPPACGVKTVVRHSEMSEMKEIMTTGSKTFSKLNVFQSERELLSAFLYRFKRLFRQDKGVQQLSKVHQALGKFSKYDVAKAMRKFEFCFPAKVPPDGSEAYLPTQQMLKWVLLRLLANAKILVRIIELCVDAGKFIYGRLYVGWSSSYMMLALGINSRILACSKYTLSKIIDWYDRLRVHLRLLKETVPFVADYVFPDEMVDFIGPIDLTPPTDKTDIDKIFELIDLTREDGSEDEGDVVIVDEVINAIDSENMRIKDGDDEITVEMIQTEGNNKIRGTMKKRSGDEDVTVLFEKTKMPKNSHQNYALREMAHSSEDLGEPVQRKGSTGKQKKGRTRRQ